MAGLVEDLPMPIIKRYPNRKLYDTEAKRYVTLDQLTDQIRQGADVHVYDHESGEELTNTILTQIILEQEKKQNGYLPSALLTGLIRSGGTSLEQIAHLLQQRLEGARDLAESNLSLEGQISRLVESGRLSLEQLPSLLNLDDRIAAILHRFNLPTHQELQQLQAQLAALDHQLAQLLAAETDPQPANHTETRTE
jgi:polyhydroxyalkanoate synthesis repressor PhaR